MLVFTFIRTGYSWLVLHSLLFEHDLVNISSAQVSYPVTSIPEFSDSFPCTKRVGERCEHAELPYREFHPHLQVLSIHMQRKALEVLVLVCSRSGFHSEEFIIVGHSGETLYPGLTSAMDGMKLSLFCSFFCSLFLHDRRLSLSYRTTRINTHSRTQTDIEKHRYGIKNVGDEKRFQYYLLNLQHTYLLTELLCIN